MIEKINVNKKIYGILGYPIKHTFSPKMQNAAFLEKNIDAIYLPFLVNPENIYKALDGIRSLNISGFNVTIPHKIEMMRYLDNVDVSTMESAYVQPRKEVPNIGKKYSVGEDKAVESDDESSGFFDLPDMDDILEDLEEIGAAMKRVATAVAWCFDSSVDNFPIGGLVGLGITITSCMFMSAAMVQISFTIKNYDPSGIARQYLGYYVFAMIFFRLKGSVYFIQCIRKRLLSILHKYFISIFM